MFIDEVLKPIITAILSYGDKNAFCINSTFFSFSDLARNISMVRAGIQRVGLQSKNIGLVVNDDLETYSSILAIWLEGYFYVPLHPRHPVERNMNVIEQSDIELIIDSSDQSIFNSVRVLSTKKMSFTKFDLEPVCISDEELAYILFTSGSTGKPKGVKISRGNLGSFLKAFWEVGFKVDENDRCLQCFDLTFDVSVQSFLVPLSRGACVYTIPLDQIKPGYAYELLEEHKLTFAVMAPSMLSFLKPYFNEINLPHLKYNILTAEASPLTLIEEWSQCIPNAIIYNFYGPTEATIYCTCYRFKRRTGNKHYNGLLSIGKPLPGIYAIVTDENGKKLDRMDKGELWIAGDQITSGYWQNPETNERCFCNETVNDRNLRFYKTGDLCLMDNDNDILYLGRLDYQVKIQGFRIELGEIEYHVRQFLKGLNTVALPFENCYGNKEIALFVESNKFDNDKLKIFLKSKLPHYMMPSRIIPIVDFPLNSNGKVDRNKLKDRLSEN